MTRIASIAAAIALFAACSPESKAQDSLGKYETVFKICKEETEKNSMQPGEHRCSTVASMAVEMSLKDSGLEEAKWRAMLEEWLKKTGYAPYYLPPDKRKAG